jgi:NADPH-dependent ferric siderophore reductase
MTVEALEIPVYRPFPVQVSRLQRLSPSFLRVTFIGADMADFASNGRDQRIKVMLPLPGRGLEDCPSAADWYGAWRALPDDRRMPIRTYTIRALRPERGEVDVDFVLHGATGPASAWAERAAVGDEIVLVGPNARFPGPTGGFEWHPPADASCLLIAGDETAVPAVCAIVESLPAGRRARVLLEVPTPADALNTAAPAGVEITWLPRWADDGTPPAPRGALLTAAVREAVEELAERWEGRRDQLSDELDRRQPRRGQGQDPGSRPGSGSGSGGGRPGRGQPRQGAQPRGKVSGRRGAAPARPGRPRSPRSRRSPG